MRNEAYSSLMCFHAKMFDSSKLSRKQRKGTTNMAK